jgi:hypothetical protein
MVPSLCFHLDSHEQPQNGHSLHKCCSQHLRNSNQNSLRKVKKLSNNAHDDSRNPLDGHDDSSQLQGRIFLKIYDCKGYFGYVMISKIRFSIFSKSCRDCHPL